MRRLIEFLRRLFGHSDATSWLITAGPTDPRQWISGAQGGHEQIEDSADLFTIGRCGRGIDRAGKSQRHIIRLKTFADAAVTRARRQEFGDGLAHPNPGFGKRP